MKDTVTDEASQERDLYRDGLGRRILSDTDHRSPLIPVTHSPSKPISVLP
jgi:hypothetical protein